MKNILILSFMHEDALYLKEFELLKEHYNKIIDYFCFPMKYYGIRATTEGETRIDEKNQIIWLHTDNIEKYDKELINKVYDCFKFIENSNIEYDVILKTNTSFIINLQKTNNIIQNSDTENTILTGIWYEYTYLNEKFNVFRGNFATFGRKIIKDIVDSFNINDSTNNVSLLCDDVYLSYYLKDKVDIVSFGQLAVTHQHDISPYCTIQNMKDFFETMGVCIKVYTDEVISSKYKNYTEFELNHFCADLTFMRLFINYIESMLVFNLNYELITHFV